MALEDYELGDAVLGGGLEDELAEVRELHRRQQGPGPRMLRRVREGFERVPELAEELLLPHSPLDLAAMAVLGPYGKPATKATAGALGVLTEPSEAEAALGAGMAKRFFSPLVELIRNLDVKKPLPEKAWRELLEPNPQTGKQARFRDPRTGLDHAVTPEEWEFARGDETLKSLTRNGPELIHKEDLADLLEEGYPQLDTKVLGGQHRGLTAMEHRELTELINLGRLLTPAESMRALELERLRNGTPSQYSSYRLKGPADDASYQESLTKYERPIPESKEEVWEVNVRDPRTGNISAGPRFADEEAATRYMESIVDQYPGAYIQRAPRGWSSAGETDDFIPRAAHFNSEPNLIAHSRADRRTTVDGLRARHVDELQSDWHQQARDEGGYRESEPAISREQLQKLQRDVSDTYTASTEAQRHHDRAWRNLVRVLDDDSSRADLIAVGRERAPEHARAALEHYQQTLVRANEAREAEGAAEEALHRATERFHDGDNRPPPAPLRKNWHEVELKKQLAQAIEDGDDVLTWTTGEQQIKRYESGLRAQVDEIQWVRHPNGKYDLVPVKGGRPVSVRTAQLEGLNDRQLEDTIGTEMARKIRESSGDDLHAMQSEWDALIKKRDSQTDSSNELSPAERKRLMELQRAPVPLGAGRLEDGYRAGTLKDSDLSVGGAGMRSFYDRTVVDAAKKLAKQYGGEYTRVKLPGERRSYDLSRRADIEDLFTDDGAFRQLDEVVSRYAHTLPEEKLDALSAQMSNLEDLRMETHPEGRVDFFNEVLNLRDMLGRAGRLALDSALGSVGTHDVHAIKITPQMREKLRAAGGKFSLYADGGFVEPAWLRDGGEVELAGGGDIMRALLRRLGIVRETPEMRRMTSEELVRPFAGEASTERQVVDELENPSRRELLFGRARPEIRTEEESTRNLPALREDPGLPAQFEGESFEGLSPLEQAARQAQRYEPNRRVFLQGAASLATAPKKLELLSDVAPKLVTEVKPKLVTPPRSKVLDAAADWVKKYITEREAGNLADDVDPHETMLDELAVKLKTSRKTVEHEIGDPYEFSTVLEPNAISDVYSWDVYKGRADNWGSPQELVRGDADRADMTPRELNRLHKRIHGMSLIDRLKRIQEESE